MEADAVLQLDMAAAPSDAARQERIAAQTQTLALIQVMSAVMGGLLALVDGIAVLKGRAIRTVGSAVPRDTIVLRVMFAYLWMALRNVVQSMSFLLSLRQEM